MTTELVTTDGEVIEGQLLESPVTLFGTNDPVAVVQRASAVATALADVIKERNLTNRIGNKEHVQVEGWTLLGSMLGVFAEVEWSKPTDNGWEARAVARTLAGQIVGAADAMCSRTESSWRNRDEYAIRSMAQTRAVSKALRLPLGFIMHLAGYSATPAEELADEQSGQGERSREAESSSATTPAPAPYRRDELVAIMREKDLDLKAVEDYASLLGIPKGQHATNEQMDRLIGAVRGHGTDAVIEQPAAEGVPPDPSVPADPPRPGTDEYRALQVGDKARARAYWAERDAEERQPEPINPEQTVLPVEAA